MDEVCYISNEYQPPNNLAKYQYFHTKNFLSLLHLEKKWHSPSWKFLETSTFYPMSTNFHSGWDVQYFKYIPTSWYYTKTFIFLHKTLYIPSSFGKKNDDIHRKSFLKHPLCTTFSLFWKVSEVCNILNKCWLPNKSVNKIFLNKTSYTPPLLQKHKTLYTPPSFEKKMHSPSQILLETYTFHHILVVFTVDEACNISNKNQTPSNLAKYIH